MPIEQIIELKFQGPNSICNPQTSYFHDKAKVFQDKSSREFTAENVAKGNAPCFLSPATTHKI